MYHTEIKSNHVYISLRSEVFRIYNEDIVLKRLKRLLNTFNNILVVLQKWIAKNILPDFGLLPYERWIRLQNDQSC